MMIAVEEFNIMIDELVGSELQSYDILLHIVDKTLLRYVVGLCGSITELKDKEYEEEIMQDIRVKVVKNCVSSFLRKEGVDGLNTDIGYFQNWLFLIAKNTVKDYAEKVRRYSYHYRGLEEDGDNMIPDPGEQNDEILQAKRELLAQMFDIVIGSNVSIYKILTWLAQSLFMLEYDITKIQSTDLIVCEFEEKTLFEMRDMVVRFSNRVSWAKITPRQYDKIDTALRKSFDGTRTYGEVRYKEYYMKKGGKKTISDWVNRMNNIIKRVISNDEALNG